MSDTLPTMDLRPIFRIGRGRIWHIARVLIEDDSNGHAHVVVRARCGMERTEWTETFGIPTCEECIQAEEAA